MKKFLSLVLALVMTMSLVTISAGAEDFTDDASITYEEAVDVMSAIGVVGGYADGSFNPTAGLTRGAAAKIICNLILGPTTAAALNADTAPYKDVATDNTFAGYIAYCQKEGIISGYADGTFRPAAPLTGYAFQKMLLGALGYDADIEGYTGANWSINVAKQAIGIGLNAGLVDSFNGSKAVTREEACLFAFNTLKATMVEYDSKTSVSVAGAEVVIAGSNAKEITNTTSTEGIKEDNKLQFAEKYFSKLSVKNASDAFGRPANLWVNNSKKIDSYVDYTKQVGEDYTTAIDGKELYDLLTSTTIKNYETTYYVDGKVDTTIKTSNMIKTNTVDYGTTGKGVLTQVFVDDDNKEITITSINTYLAKVLADYNTKTETLSVNVYADRITDGQVKLDDVAGIEEYKEDDMIMVNAAWNGKTYEIVDILDPESTSDVALTKYSEKSYIVADGEQIDYAYGCAKVAGSLDEMAKYNNSALKDITYTLYIDQYGYLIGIEKFSGELKYLFMTGYDKPSSYLATKTAEAAVIFLDGTMDTVEVKVADTNENIEAAQDGNYAKLATGANQYNKWFSYKTDKNGVYTLTPAEDYLEMAEDDMKINSASVRLSQVVNNTTKRAYGNDDSVYITVETDAVDSSSWITTDKLGICKVTGTYTGVQDVDMKTVDSDLYYDTNVFALYDEDLYIIGAIIIGEDVNTNTHYAYAYKAAQNEYVDADGNEYWDFKAIVDGKVATLTVKEEYGKTLADLLAIKTAIKAQNGDMFKLTYDKEGYVIDAERCDDTQNDYVYSNGEFGTQIDTDNDKVYNVAFAPNRELFVVGRTLYVEGTNPTDVGLTVEKDAPIVVIQPTSTGLSVEEYSTVAQALNSLKDSDNFNGSIAAVLNNKGTAEYLVINSSDNIDVTLDDGTTVVPSGYTAKISMATMQVKVEGPAASADAAKAEILTAAVAELQNAGYEIASFDGKWTYTVTNALGGVSTFSVWYTPKA